MPYRILRRRGCPTWALSYHSPRTPGHAQSGTMPSRSYGLDSDGWYVIWLRYVLVPLGYHRAISYLVYGLKSCARRHRTIEFALSDMTIFRSICANTNFLAADIYGCTLAATSKLLRRPRATVAGWPTLMM